MQKVKRVFLKKKNLLTRMLMLALPLAFLLVFLSQTAFAQNTYVITDGGKVYVHTTFSTDPELILGEAGLELDANDTYTTQIADGISEITVQRGAEPEAQPNVPAVQRTETYTVAIPYGVNYCRDASLPEGAQEVLTKGIPGEKTCTANVVYAGDQELSRNVISERVVVQPTDELIAVGTGNESSVSQAQAEEKPAFTVSDGFITLASGEQLAYTDTMTVWATAYTCEGYAGITATGTRAREGEIAVDPEVIPYGTRMFIVSNDGEIVYGIATAEDTGHPDFICGNRVDLYFDTLSQCIEFGYRDCTVYFLGETELVREYWGY